MIKLSMLMKKGAAERAAKLTYTNSGALHGHDKLLISMFIT